MATNLYEPFTNPVTGETFKCISFTNDSYKMDWTVAPKGYVAFEHIHYFQDEIFRVKKGQLKLIIDGKTLLLKSGDESVVPMGHRHIAENYGDQVLECEVEYCPGLDFYTFFQCYVGLIKDKEYDKKGQMSITKMAYFMNKTRCHALARPTSVPKPLFKLGLKFFGIIGYFAGWKTQLEKYTA
jgi:mannose-6-phosphate isomerase-like protein (cupin superfamily)